MRAVILQSGYIPWLGFFDLVDKADVFIILDEVQYTKQDWRNRNRIRTPKGWQWLTVPVKLEKPHWNYKIKEVMIDHSKSWVEQHLGAIRAYYGKSPYFKEVYPILDVDINWIYPSSLSQLNVLLIMDICDYLGLGTEKFILSGKLNIPKELGRDERLVYALKRISGVDSYLTGPAARDYLEPKVLEKEGIKVEWHDYKHPYYNQYKWGTNIFISHLSVLDILFSHGKESLDVITGRRIIEKPNNIKEVKP